MPILSFVPLGEVVAEPVGEEMLDTLPARSWFTAFLLSRSSINLSINRGGRDVGVRVNYGASRNGVVRRPSADGNSRSSMILSFMICGARVRGNHGVEPRVLGDQHASVCRGRSKVVGKPTSMGRCYNKGAVAFVESKRTDAKPTLTQAPFLPATAECCGAR